MFAMFPLLNFDFEQIMLADTSHEKKKSPSANKNELAAQSKAYCNVFCKN